MLKSGGFSVACPSPVRDRPLARGDVVKGRGLLPIGISLFLILFPHAVHPAWAQSNSELTTFKKLALFDLEDRHRQGLGKIISRQIWQEFESTFRFEVLPPQLISEKFPESRERLIDLSQRLGVDGVISGFVEDSGGSIKIGLMFSEAKSGHLFAKEVIILKNWKNPRVVDKGVKAMVEKLIGRIPYRALVTDINARNRTIRVDAGQLNGLAQGMNLEIYRIRKVKRNPFTQEVIGIEKIPVADAVVRLVEDRSSSADIARLQKGQGLSKDLYVGFEPSAKVLSQMAQRKADLLAQRDQEIAVLERRAREKKVAEKPRVSRGGLSILAGPAWSRFSLDSAQLEFNRDASAFLYIHLQGEYWITPSLGLDAVYDTGFIQFDRVQNVPVEVRARPSWYALHVDYRYLFRPGSRDLELIGRLGYAGYSFGLSKTDNQFFYEYRYGGPSVGLEARFPLSTRLATRIGIEYQPFLKIRESQGSNGDDPTSWAIGFHVEGRWYLGNGFWASLQYLFKGISTDFTGIGTRAGGLTFVQTRELLNTVLFGLALEI